MKSIALIILLVLAVPMLVACDPPDPSAVQTRTAQQVENLKEAGQQTLQDAAREAEAAGRKAAEDGCNAVYDMVMGGPAPEHCAQHRP